MDQPDPPTAVGSNDLLGMVPERAAYFRWVDAYNSRALRILDADGAHAAGYAAGVAAERERCAKLCEELPMYGPDDETAYWYGYALLACAVAIRAA